MASEKQLVLTSILQRGIFFIKSSTFGRVFVQKWLSIALYLLHRIPNSIIEEDSTENDLSFLNEAEHNYLIDGVNSPLYLFYLEQIRELFLLVPEHQKENLAWSGPTHPTNLVQQRNEFKKERKERRCS